MIASSVGVTLVVAAAGFAGAAARQDPASGRTGTMVNACTNPVLERDLWGWGPQNNGAPAARVPVKAHVVAEYAYFQSKANGADPQMYLPQKRVTPGDSWTFAMDTWVKGPATGVSARMQVDWFDEAGKNLGHDDGADVPVPSSAEEKWTRVAGDFTAPENAATANVTARLEAPAGMAWTSTACDYRPADLAPDPGASGAEPSSPPSSSADPSSPVEPPEADPSADPSTEPDESAEPVAPAASGDTAAAKFNWGAPAWTDDFTGNAPSKDWGLYDAPGHQHGNRKPENCQVSGGTLKLVSEPNRDTCGMAHKRTQTHGRWEARVKSTGSGWMSLFIIWPDPGDWPANGEYDWREHEAGGKCYTGYIHYPGHTPKRQEKLPDNCAAGGTAQWHNIAYEWTATRMAGFVDGKLWYEFDCKATEDLCRMPAGHLTIQNDDQGSGPGNSAVTEVDWVRGWDV
ncbi:hypothetical protein Val02_21020 [Virgisporangium aliadipatigenens]|uniref:GH16 domain-containing protein n=1 Tax=Virgisporangium aliadipatigenens TaxID=741659 RepID=A0A8J3YJS1_9ACTN|nr:hypothetical protein Val02_21020 [Virgisporangium aliadipatigenens]